MQRTATPRAYSFSPVCPYTLSDWRIKNFFVISRYIVHDHSSVMDIGNGYRKTGKDRETLSEDAV